MSQSDSDLRFQELRAQRLASFPQNRIDYQSRLIAVAQEALRVSASQEASITESESSKWRLLSAENSWPMLPVKETAAFPRFSESETAEVNTRLTVSCDATVI